MQGSRHLRRALPLLLAVLWLMAMGFLYLMPALSHGSQLGDYELLRAFGLGKVPGTPLHNIVSSDQIQESIPWTNLSWVQVHAGHLPLWNPYVGLGLPLAFNLQSASFSLTTTISYAFPLPVAYSVVVFARLLVGGTGALFFGRVIGLSWVPATFGATVFELSGAFTAWLGWPQAAVMCWLGWIFGSALLLCIGQHRRRDYGLLAAFTGMAILGGHPESWVIVAASSAIFLALWLLIDRTHVPTLRGKLAAAGRVAAAAATGLLLAAPLLLPAIPVIASSSRTGPVGYIANPVSSVVNLAFGTFYGLPALPNVYFGPGNYYELAAYVGAGALILGGVAVGVKWRQAEVLGLLGTAVVLGVLIYSGWLSHALAGVPLVNAVVWNRALVPLDLVLAVLAAIGLQLVLEAGHARPTAKWLVASSCLGAAAVAAVGIAAQELGHTYLGQHASASRELASSFLVPGIQVGTAVVAAGALILAMGLFRNGADTMAKRARRAAAALLVVPELVFLITAAPGLWSSWTSGLTPTPLEAQLEKLVGSSRVGFGFCPALDAQPDLGILTEANSAFGVSEFAVYDPVLPAAYLSAWTAATGRPAPHVINNFCPAVTSVKLAQEFGVSYVLEGPGAPAPPGMTPVARLGDEELLRVPHSSVVTFVADGDAASSEEALAATSSGSASLSVTTDSRSGGTVYFHITDTPGWSATVDGEPLPLANWDQAMLSARINGGQHRITLSYMPVTFPVGLALSAGAAAVFAAVAGLGRRRPLSRLRKLPRCAHRSASPG